MTWPTKTDFVDGDVLTAAQVNNIGTNLNLADPTSATDGQVLTADGAGSMAFESIAAGAFTTLASGSLSGSSLSLTSISQSYTALILELTDYRPSLGTATGVFRYNAISSGSYFGIDLGSASAGGTNNAFSSTAGLYVAAQNTLSNSATYRHFVRATVWNYTASDVREMWIEMDHGGLTNGGNRYFYKTIHYVTTTITGPIDQLSFTLSTGTFSSGNYKLLGMK